MGDFGYAAAGGGVDYQGDGFGGDYACVKAECFAVGNADVPYQVVQAH